MILICQSWALQWVVRISIDLKSFWSSYSHLSIWSWFWSLFSVSLWTWVQKTRTLSWINSKVHDKYSKTKYMYTFYHVWKSVDSGANVPLSLSDNFFSLKSIVTEFYWLIGLTRNSGPMFTKKSKMSIRYRIYLNYCHYSTKYHVNWMKILPSFQEDKLLFNDCWI